MSTFIKYQGEIKNFKKRKNWVKGRGDGYVQTTKLLFQQNILQKPRLIAKVAIFFFLIL